MWFRETAEVVGVPMGSDASQTSSSRKSLGPWQPQYRRPVQDSGRRAMSSSVPVGRELRTTPGQYRSTRLSTSALEVMRQGITPTDRWSWDRGDWRRGERTIKSNGILVHEGRFTKLFLGGLVIL
jgi:hypothetical protein